MIPSVMKRTRRFTEPKNPVGQVAELFAGVGGFRIGLSKAGWETTFSNQWEPSTKQQHASSVYVANFGPQGHTDFDIAKVEKIPTKVDLLVGGFPCQDYSVAKTLKDAKGLRGKKGVLWWEILRLVELHKPKFVFLENVDRLLKSPATQRGRDFAIMLRTLGDAGYMVEWRVVNAADYGFPQRRIRVFIVARKITSQTKYPNPYEYITKKGILARALKASPLQLDCSEVVIDEDVSFVSRNFNKQSGAGSPFLNSGLYIGGVSYTLKTEANPGKIRKMTLGDILQEESEVDDSFYIPFSKLKEWKYLKGAKSIERIHKASGAKYRYEEGSMAFPDQLNKPSRTILTAEGGTSPSRFKHIIKTKKGYRRLTPIELERLNGFPDDWTLFDSEGKRVSDTKRAFFMGNALVIGLIEKVGEVLAQEMKRKQK
jgi:DNA (cytosine-5)-methyltransferase 1